MKNQELPKPITRMTKKINQYLTVDDWNEVYKLKFFERYYLFLLLSYAPNI